MFFETEQSVNGQGIAGTFGVLQTAQRSFTIFTTTGSISTGTLTKSDSGFKFDSLFIGGLVITGIQVFLFTRGFALNIAIGPTASAVATFTFSMPVAQLSGSISVFVDNTSQSKAVMLPDCSTRNGIMVIIKLKAPATPGNGIRSCWVFTNYGNNSIEDGILNWNAYSQSFPTVSLNDDYQCVMFTSFNGVWYIIANGNRLSSSGGITPTDPTKIGNAVTNNVNVFRVPSSGQRLNGNNLCTLPTESQAPGRLCIVVYTGTSTTGSNRALQFAGNGNIDRRYTSGNRPFVITDDNNKSTGAVFISDGQCWYIIGYYDTFCQLWGTALNADPGSTQISSDRVRIHVANNSPMNLTQFLILPPNSALPSGQSYLVITKIRNVTGGRGFRYYANPPGSTTNSRMGEYTNGNWENNCGNNIAWNAHWHVCERRAGENFLHWYPVLNINQ